MADVEPLSITPPASAWVGSVVGPQGPQGPEGAPGTPGAQGPQGIQGVAGSGAPTGSVFFFAGAAAPTGFLLCDGSLVSRTTYAALFTAIGTTWGAGDGSTTFKLPDLRSRVPVGAGQGASLTNRVLAASGGEETHLLTTAEIPSHLHTYFSSQGGPVNVISGGSQAVYTSNGQWNTNSVGGGGSHNVMNPFVVLTPIIKT